MKLMAKPLRLCGKCGEMCPRDYKFWQPKGISEHLVHFDVLEDCSRICFYLTRLQIKGMNITLLPRSVCS